jgi:hypothetical protein
MPLDQIDIHSDRWFNERATFEYKYSVWPRRCYNSGRWLWLTTAMRGRRIITGPGEPIIEDRWYDSNEGLIMMIKGVAE